MIIIYSKMMVTAGADYTLNTKTRLVNGNKSIEKTTQKKGSSKQSWIKFSNYLDDCNITNENKKSAPEESVKKKLKKEEKEGKRRVKKQYERREINGGGTTRW